MSEPIRLKDFNTFGIDATCDDLLRIRRREDLAQLAGLRPGQCYILGGGSNVLMADHICRTIIKNEVKGIEIVSQTAANIDLRVGGGEVWHDLVMYAVERGWGGLENMSLIPGTVGAAPVQNIGAYGVEQDQLFVALTAYDLVEGLVVHFDRQACDFAYRDSFFKSKQPGRYLILDVTYRLTKGRHIINTSYGAIQTQLESEGVGEPTIKAVSEAVMAIRTYKLPDPSEVPNAGSFFKNPVVFAEQYEELKHRYPDMPSYALTDGTYKIPAGWLIDQCGFKGQQVGHTGCYKNQALVIVNHGGATGQEILAFAQKVQQTVLEKYGIHLIPEVNAWGF